MQPGTSGTQSNRELPEVKQQIMEYIHRNHEKLHLTPTMQVLSVGYDSRPIPFSSAEKIVDYLLLGSRGVRPTAYNTFIKQISKDPYLSERLCTNLSPARQKKTAPITGENIKRVGGGEEQPNNKHPTKNFKPQLW